MRWCRIRLVLLGLILCVVHVMGSTCGQQFTDPASSALLSDVVIEGKVRKTADPAVKDIHNITIAVKKNTLKGPELINKGRPAKTLTISSFRNGEADPENCIGSVQTGRTYIFFLKDTADPKGLHFQLLAMPVKKTKKTLADVRKILCESCAQAPSIANMTGRGHVDVGAKLTLKCIVDGKPTPELAWYKDGNLLKNKGGIRINTRKRQSTLQIKRVKEQDSGEYECLALNAVGESRKNMTVKVGNDGGHTVPCQTQTWCLNGGTCMHTHNLGITFCRCPNTFVGTRCEKQDTQRVITGGVDKVDRMYERTLVIVTLVIAVLVFIIICITSYFLAKRGRKRYEERRKRQEAKRAEQNQPSIAIDRRSITRSSSNKETGGKSDNLPLDSASKHLQPNTLQNLSSPPFNQLSPGEYSMSTQQFQYSSAKISYGGSRPHPRGRLAAASVYENSGHAEPLKVNKGAVTAALPENIEMNVIAESKEANDKLNDLDMGLLFADLRNKNESTNQTYEPPPQLPHSLEPSSLPISSQRENQILEIHPRPDYVLPSAEPSVEPSAPYPHSEPDLPLQNYDDNFFSLDENDTAIQPLLSNDTKDFSVHYRDQPLRPFESKSDRDLSRYLPPVNGHQGPREKYNKNCLENKRLLRDLTKLSHSSTFPKAKVNGLETDTFSESDEEDVQEVPYEKQADLYISEEDLGLSAENLVSSSFSSVTPSRKTSHEDHGLVLAPRSGLSRPGIRKHQSEEGSAYSKLINKSHIFLQDGARSRSLDNPTDSSDISRNSGRLNSTVAGSPDVETYDNMIQQTLQLHNRECPYDPSDDSAPWDREANSINRSSLTDEEIDKLNRLRDVLPNQPAIPI